jgi:hypothetical protein
VRELSGGFAGVTTGPGRRERCSPRPWTGSAPSCTWHSRAGRLGDAAADLVRHGADDLLAHGARPLAFLDYIAQARLDPAVVTRRWTVSRAVVAKSARRSWAARPPRCPTPTRTMWWMSPAA